MPAGLQILYCHNLEIHSKALSKNRRTVGYKKNFLKWRTNFYFSRFFCWDWQNFYFGGGRGGCILGYHSMVFRHFPDIP